MYFSNEKIMERDMEIFDTIFLYTKNLVVTYKYGMLPLFSDETYSTSDYFIIDECDSMILDHAQEFKGIYKSLNQKVGGLFFLTATQFEHI